MSTNFPTSLETRPALPTGVAVPKASEASIAELLPFLHWAMDAIVALEAKVGVNSSAVSTSLDYRARSPLRVWHSESFDLDNGAGTTVDRAIRFEHDVTLVTARIMFEDATTGTVAAGNMRLGTSVGGSEIAAAVAYGDGLAVGVSLGLTLLVTAITAGTSIYIRHTGVAATQAGRAHLQLEYRPT